MMTRKDYIKFADLLRELKEDKQILSNGEIDINYYESQLLNGLISIFKTDNRNFDITRFKDYINK
tara:strand:+ start:162 stop:356 length:195 start_codon:yes stop_codon:yes gene_type:complete